MDEQQGGRDRADLAYRDSGPVHGNPVVLLHGAGSDSSTWDAIRAWPEDWRVIRVDLPGHGHSPWLANYALPEMADSVITLIRNLNLGQVDLVGHSMGAMVAYILAERAPGLVRRLGLVEPPPPVPASPPRDEGPRPHVPLSYDWSFQAAFTRSRNNPDRSWWEDLSQISAETLILAGQHGSYPADTHQDMAQEIPNCRVTFLDTGHQVHQERPLELMAALRQFLESRTRPSAKP